MPSYSRLPFAVVSLIIGLVAATAPAATITVTSSSSAFAIDGSVTLPEAISSINSGTNINADVVASGTYGSGDTILFAIPGAGVHTIALGSAQTIVRRMTINGYSQAGSSPNSLLVGDNAVLTIEISGGGFAIAAGGDGTVIRGLAISTFNAQAIFISSSGNTIAGNFIGTNPAGSMGLPLGGLPGGDGIFLFAFPGTVVSNNVIGGTAPADRNIISGNIDRQVEIYRQVGGVADGNVIEGNYIGAAADGLTYIAGTSSMAVRVVQADHTLIGGTTGTTPGGVCTGSCNVIYGVNNGVSIEGDETIDRAITNTVGTTIQGNFIGPNASGNANLNNDGTAGISVRNVNGGATIGGTSPAARNVISGGEWGIFLSADHGNVLPIVVQGNYLGLNSAGTATLPASPIRPGYDGIVASGSNIVIGGTTPGSGNTIAYDGIQNTTEINLDSTENVTIQGNIIGTLADGITPAGNRSRGIHEIFSTGSTIGATLPGGIGGNIIAGNNNGGIFINDGVESRIFGNSVFNNGNPPIDITPFGDNPNDGCDTDTGSNGLQNYPVITSAVANGATITINGSLNSVPSSMFALDFFSDTAASGQARTPIGAGSVTTGANCAGLFSVTLPATFAPSMIVRATATGDTGTSELSAAAAVLLSGPAVSKSFSPGVISPGATSVLTIRLTNTTSVPVTGVTLADTFPANLVNALQPAVTNTCGGTATALPGGGAISLTGATIPASGFCTVAVAVTSVVPNVYTNTIGAGVVTSSNTLPNVAGNSAILTVALPLSVSKVFFPHAVLPGHPSLLTIGLSNPNPFSVSGISLVDSYPAGLLNATPANAATTCGGSVGVSATTITLSAATIPANSTCVVTTNVLSSTEKVFTNVLEAGAVTATNAPPTIVQATAALSVSTNIPLISSLGLCFLGIVFAVMGCVAIRRG